MSFEFLVETMRQRNTLNNRYPGPTTAALRHHMPDDTQIGTKPTLYFGYGSNLWIDQMNRRCPDNKYIGVGVLREW